MMQSISRCFNWFVFFAVNFIFQPLILLAIKKKKIFNFLFLVYPASLREVAFFEPAWMRIFTPPITIIGTIWSKDADKRGLVATVPFMPQDLSNKNNGGKKIKKILAGLKKFSQKTNISILALAGRLPSLIIGKRFSVDYPLVNGDKGTVFSILEAVMQAVSVENIQLAKTKIAVLGIGFIGRRIILELAQMGFGEVIGIDTDPRKTQNQIQGVKLANDYGFLPQCRMVIVLSAKGDDIRAATDSLMNGVAIIDDTYPPISDSLSKLLIKQKQAKIYRTMIGLDGVNFMPPLPGFGSGWLPGCVIEAIVLSVGKKSVLPASQDAFNQKARLIGFKPILLRNNC